MSEWAGEHCRDCGRGYETVWWADQVLWHDLTGWGQGGLLCPRCFDKRAFYAGVPIRWLAVPLRDREPDGRVDVATVMRANGWTDREIGAAMDARGSEGGVT